MMHRFWRFRLRKEKRELAFVQRLDLKGKTVFDVGANKGVYSYWLSRCVGPNGSVFAFEPQPELQPHLARVKKTFNLENLHAINKACSDNSGEVRLFRDFSGAGHASIEQRHDRSEFVNIEKITIDDFSKKNNIENVAFIKLDVEGHELNALMGGQVLLRKVQPLLLLEYHWAQAAGHRLFCFLEKIGYEGFCFAGNGICHHTRIDQLTKTAGHGSFVFGPTEYMKKHATIMAESAWLPDCKPIF